jgi:hypothetical protein
MPAANRRSALLTLSAAFLGMLGIRESEAEEKPPIPGAWEVVLTSRELPIQAESAPVRWKGQEYRLVRLGEARFFQSPRGRVTAELKGGTLTFDDVEYEVHAALFDAAGKLLGTAHTLCPVSRIWLGKPALTSTTLSLDFGISKAYARAEWFTVSITERDVLTPDQWQK